MNRPKKREEESAFKKSKLKMLKRFILYCFFRVFGHGRTLWILTMVDRYRSEILFLFLLAVAVALFVAGAMIF